MRGIKIVQKIFRRKINREARAFLDSLGQGAGRHRETATRALANLSAGCQPKLLFGTTTWGQPMEVPMNQAISHGLVVGASGAGKSYAVLGFITHLLHQIGSPHAPAFGILDGKGELFEKCLTYLYAHLYRLPAAQRTALQQKIVIIDFSNAEVITPYHLLARQVGVADEILVSSRIEMISEQFSGLSVHIPKERERQIRRVKGDFEEGEW